MNKNQSVPAEEKEVRPYAGMAANLIDEMERVIKGKRSFLLTLICAYIAGGHVLLEDYPGLGKTTVAKALAALISMGAGRRRGSSFRRIQFTPDLLPYDITGVEVYTPETHRFKFVPGPVFAQVVLADEINRAGPKVQSALLEVMAENQVTVGNKSYPMDALFFVIATQNPLEIEGTYPLPLAQMDRFLMRLSLGYPDMEAEMAILIGNPSEQELPRLKPVCTRQVLLEAREMIDRIYCAPELVETAIEAASLSRNHKNIYLGISPRGTLHLLRAARSLALIQGREYVIDQDFLDLSGPVWGHRLRSRDIAKGRGVSPRELLTESLKRPRSADES